MRRCLLLLPLLTGCVSLGPPADPLPAAAGYRLGCPDVVAVRFADRPRWDAVASVDVDGTLPLGDAGRPHVVGKTADEAVAVIADEANVSPELVAVEVVAPKAGRVFVTGPDNRRTRAFPYPGPVPADEFLRSTGLLANGSADNSAIYLVRPNVAVGELPEVFRLPAELALLPGDRLYLGEHRLASFARLMPKWGQPAYRRLVGLQ